MKDYGLSLMAKELAKVIVEDLKSRNKQEWVLAHEYLRQIGTKRKK